MFPYRIISVVAILLAVGSGCNNPESHSSPPGDSIIGVWEYLEDDVLHEVAGMSFFTEKHFAFVVNYAKDTLASEREVISYSGVYTVRDSVVTATIHYAHNQALIGQNLRWIHGVDGRTASYQVLDKSGTVVESGKVRRLE